MQDDCIAVVLGLPQPKILWQQEVDSHGQSPWYFMIRASLDALRASFRSPAGKTCGTSPFGLLEDWQSR
ncbi:hypothetical protein ACFLUO_02295 [Chloroflexota bacterium]